MLKNKLKIENNNLPFSALSEELKRSKYMINIYFINQNKYIFKILKTYKLKLFSNKKYKK